MIEKGASVREFREGWPVLLSAMLGIGLSLSSLPFYTLGPLAPELAEAFGWRFGQIMAGPSIVTISILLGSPLVGLLSDRFGVRRVVLVSVPLFGLSFMTFGLSSGSIVQYYLSWVLVAVAGCGSLPITWTWIVNSRFEASKGLALGLALLGTGLFASVAKPLVSWLLSEFGWRQTYMMLGALPLLLSFPLALLFFTDVPRAQPAGHGNAGEAEATGYQFGEVVRQWRFWLLIVALVPISFAVAGPIPNLENILKWTHFAPADVVTLASYLGLAIIMGRLAGGWLIDRYWAPGVALVMLSAPALACALFATGELSFPVAAVAIILFGIGTGVEFDLMAFLVARYFGMKSYGRVYGFVYAAFALGAGAGPIYFGWAYDRSGSYAAPLSLSAILFLAGALSLLSLGTYRFQHAPKKTS